MSRKNFEHASVTLGVCGDGERVVLDVRLAGDESTAAWRDVIRSLVDRHVGVPRLAMIDGSAGLAAALREQWPSLAIQRCTAHKLRNLEAKAPVRLREDLAEDYRRMIYAETRRVALAHAMNLKNCSIGTAASWCQRCAFSSRVRRTLTAHRGSLWSVVNAGGSGAKGLIFDAGRNACPAHRGSP